MLAGIRSRLTYANVVSTLCLFLLLGGGAYATFSLPKDSVKSKHIVDGQVKEADLAAPDGLTPLALNGGNGGTDCHWKAFEEDSPYFSEPSYFRDRDGVVHLHGMASAFDGTSEACVDSLDQIVGNLPPGYRPEALTEFVGLVGNDGRRIEVHQDLDGAVEVSNLGLANAQDPDHASLDGISFRCAPSGVDGCP